MWLVTVLIYQWAAFIPLINHCKNDETNTFPTSNVSQSFADISSNSWYDWTENETVVCSFKRGQLHMANALKLLNKVQMSPISFSSTLDKEVFL